MPVNIEIKARVADLARLRQRAAALTDTPVQVIPQEDTFFNTPRGRLKLRQLAPGLAQLVFYERKDSAGPKRSDYIVAVTSEPEKMKAALAAALGVRGVIRKKRSLYILGQTRLHLDEVEGLGEFMELEVVLQPGQTDAEGQAIARELMVKLEVQEADLLECAYMDLLENKEV
jgi:predicted adenylyl cyclase CyaB